MSTMRDKVCAIGREWIGTPFLPGNCTKGRGCDCGSFLAGVFAEAGVIELPALGPYNYLGPAMRGDGFYVETIRRYADSIGEGAAKPGDVVLYVLGRAPSHAALVIDWPRAVIHATAQHGVVLASGVGGMLHHRPRGFYRMRGLD